MHRPVETAGVSEPTQLAAWNWPGERDDDDATWNITVGMTDLWMLCRSARRATGVRRPGTASTVLRARVDV